MGGCAAAANKSDFEREEPCLAVVNTVIRRPRSGLKYVRRGLAKAKGGVGRKVTGKTGRWFKPNLQHLKVVETNGQVHRVWICSQVP